MTTKDFIKTINDKRKDSKHSWYTFVGMVEGKRVELKAYGLWNQILRVDGINHGGIEHKKVSDWKTELENSLKHDQRS